MCNCRTGEEEERTFSDARSWVSAVGASFLLDVERTGAWRCIVSFHGRVSIAAVVMSNAPQRLHRTWVLLWRLPKLDVPFAVRIRQSLQSLVPWLSSVDCNILIVAVLTNDGCLRREVIECSEVEILLASALRKLPPTCAPRHIFAKPS